MRQGWLIGLVGLALVSCAKEKPKGNGWTSFPVSIYTDASVVGTDADVKDFEAALSFWESRAGTKIFAYQGNWDTTSSPPFTGSATQPGNIIANVVFFLNPWPFDSNTAGQTTVITQNGTVSGSIVMLNPRISLCHDDCRGDNFRVSQQKLLAHELGHFIGMQHINDTANLMNPYLLPGGALEEMQVDVSALNATVRK